MSLYYKNNIKSRNIHLSFIQEWQLIITLKYVTLDVTPDDVQISIKYEFSQKVYTAVER